MTLCAWSPREKRESRSPLDPDPVHCHACGEVVIKDLKLLGWYLISKDITCPKCDAVVIAAPRHFL